MNFAPPQPSTLFPYKIPALAFVFVPEIGPGFSLGIQPFHRIGVLTPGSTVVKPLEAKNFP